MSGFGVWESRGFLLRRGGSSGSLASPTGVGITNLLCSNRLLSGIASVSRFYFSVLQFLN